VLFVVGADQDERPLEARVGDARNGDQQLAGEESAFHALDI